MEAQRKRKEEEARQIAEMHRLNAEMRAREKQEALLIAQRRAAAEYEALMAAVEAEQQTEAGSIDENLEDEEQAWLEKKVARDEAMFGKSMGVTKGSDQSDLAALAAAIGAARVQREYEEPAKVTKDNKPWWQKAWEGLVATTAVFSNTPTSTPTPTRTPLPSNTPTISTVPTPRAMPVPTPALSPSLPHAQSPVTVGKSPELDEVVRTVINTIPSAKVGSWRNPTSAFSFVSTSHAISFGTVASGTLSSDANPNMTLNSDGSITPSVGSQPIFSPTLRPDGFDLNLRNPWQKYEYADGTIKATLSSSATVRVTWGGFWNTTVGLDVNTTEVQMSGAGVKGRGSSGWYLEYKPGRILTYLVAAPIIIGGAIALGYYILQTGDTSVLKPVLR